MAIVTGYIKKKGEVYMGIIVFLFVLIFFNSLCFGQAYQSGTNRIMIKGQWVDAPVFTTKGGTRSYYDTHPEERVTDMYQKSTKDIMKASPPPSDEPEEWKREAYEEYRKKTYGLTPPPSHHQDDAPTPPPTESVPFFHGKPGTSYTTIGNTRLGSDGSISTRTGNSNLNSDLTIDNQFGNTLFKSDGTTVNRIGNTTFGSDGTTCTKIGNQTFCH